ncbi:MAG: helix-turn-helix transcriptional regulator [Gammaproteobacteria bacterium]|nr:helix-turn-helix transcriptional regulator [Gammaproteobacteria bacterium]
MLIKSELCVCDIAESINLSVPATSQQLKMLKQAGILVQRNTGKMVYYSFANPEVEGVITSLLSNIIEKI